MKRTPDFPVKLGKPLRRAQEALSESPFRVAASPYAAAQIF
jgi:hypothetical protein